MKNELMIFEESQVSMIVDAKGNVLFELYSTGMALGYVETKKGKLYARKQLKMLEFQQFSTVENNI